MTKITVYRVETVNGYGPYRNRNDNSKFGPECQDFLAKMAGEHNSRRDTHPGLGIDCWGPYWWEYTDQPWSKYICGFHSIASMKKWFYGFRAGLRRYGFKLAVYEVDLTNVVYGRSGNQLCFRNGKLVKNINIT